MPDRSGWLLVDGSSIIFRAFFGIPQSFKSPSGKPVNAVRGFLDNLARLITEYRPHSLAIGTDEDWRPAFRVAALPSYKSHRVAEPIPPGLIPQMPLAYAVVEAIGLEVVRVPGFEAEDVIASLAAKIKGPIDIYSGDRDLFALVRDPDVRVIYPEKGGPAVITEGEIERRYGVPGHLYADFAILRGDPSDGLPGVPGVGAKTAAGLLRRYGGLEGILSQMDWAPPTRAYLEAARKVVYPVPDLAVTPKPGLPRQVLDLQGMEMLRTELGVDSSLRRLLTALGISQT